MLSQLYAVQKIYQDLGLQLTQAFMNGTAVAAVDGIEIDNDTFAEHFGSVFELIVSLEGPLLDLYEKALVDLGHPVPRAATTATDAN